MIIKEATKETSFLRSFVQRKSVKKLTLVSVWCLDKESITSSHSGDGHSHCKVTTQNTWATKEI